MLRVTDHDIKHRGAAEMVDLLRILLQLEARKHGIPQAAVRVPGGIDIADGGIDGWVECQALPGEMNDSRIPSRLTGFQVKSGSKAKPESFTRDVFVKSRAQPLRLKPQVARVLQMGGCYVAFVSWEMVDKREKAAKAILDKVRAAGLENVDESQIRIYDATTIAAWVNQYSRAVIQVYRWSDRTIPGMPQTWEELADSEPFFRIPYVTTPFIDGLMNELDEALSRPRSVARVTGLPGLGKTRFILEAFREGQTEIRPNLQKTAMIYFDAGFGCDGILDFVSDCIHRGEDGVIVVDRCPPEVKARLIELMRRGKNQLRVILIDSGALEITQAYRPLNLEPGKLTDVVSGMLRLALPELKERDLERFEKYASGFPLIAIHAAAARNSGAPLAGLTEKELAVRLVGCKSEDEIEYKTIQACAVFTAFPFQDEHINFIAGVIAKVDEREFRRALGKLKHRGVLRDHQGFLSVSPPPLALRLAGQWYDGMSWPELGEILKGAQELELYEGLVYRLRRLDWNKSAVQLAERLCGPDGPLSKPEFLTSKEGSRFLRSIAEVNPSAAARAIELAFDGWSLERLKEVKSARTELLWALEMLAFWTETFPTAARVMMAFAAAENEPRSNNATAQFFQLFHILLPGTQAPLMERLDILREGLARGEAYQFIALRALGHGLDMRYFSRTGGVEEQGTRPTQKDYSPSWREIDEYQITCLELLTQHAEIDPELVKELIGERLRGLVRLPTVEALDKSIRAIIEAHGPDWKQAIQSLHDGLMFEALHLEEREKIEEWLALLRPKDTVGRIRAIISEAPFYASRSEEDKSIDLAMRDAQVFAEELAAQRPDWRDLAPHILQGEQRFGYILGECVARSGEDPEKFVSICLDFLRASQSNRNPAVLIGFLNGLPRSEFIDAVLDTIFESVELRPMAMDVATWIPLRDNDLIRLISMVRRGIIPVEALTALRYRSVLKCLPRPAVAQFLKDVAEFSSIGRWVALDLLQMYTFNEPEQLNFYHGLAIPLISDADLGALYESDHLEQNLYAWTETIESLANGDRLTPDLAGRIMDQIVERFRKPSHGYHSNYRIGRAFLALIEKAYPTVWPIFSELLLEEPGTNGRTEAIHLIAGDNTLERDSSWLLTGLPVEYLVAWLREHKPEGPKAIAEVMPMLKTEGRDAEWHPFAQRFIDEFGGEAGVQERIRRNYHSFGCRGSAIPYFQRMRHLFSRLLKHDDTRIARWVRHEIRYLDSRIEEESKHDARFYNLFEE